MVLLDGEVSASHCSAVLLYMVERDVVELGPPGALNVNMIG